MRVDVVPEEYRAEALIEALGAHPLAGERVLIPRAKVAREILPEKLREAGAEVVVPPAYESVPSSEGKEEVSLRLQSGEIDCVTFTASSTVENFVGAFGAEEAARLLDGDQGRVHRPDHGRHGPQTRSQGRRPSQGVHYPRTHRGGHRPPRSRPGKEE